MNNIFLKNISTLTIKNPKLAQKLQTYIPTDIPQLIQENNFYNLLYKNQKTHNPTNPLAEAEAIFSQAKNEPISIHIIYGLGLGYLFQIASKNSKGSVILYEPDLNILWTVFTLVDFSNDLLKNNIFITNDYNDLAKSIYQKSGMKNLPELISLPSQRNMNEKDFDSFVEKIRNLIGSFSLDLKYTKEKFFYLIEMLLYNIPTLINEIPLKYIKDSCKNKTAVIVSAGPTLDRNIETLKKYRDRFVLFSVGTAAKTLYANNLKPDFLVIIENFNCKQQIEGLDISDVNFITEPYSHNELRNYKCKNTYCHISTNTPVNHFWSEIVNEDIEEYTSKGTVSYTAINSARILGCKKIVLVGQDLAYIEGQCYSKDSAYKDLVCGINPETNKWEIIAKNFDEFASALSSLEDPEARKEMAKKRLQNLNNSLHLVKGINGDMIPTESVYATFVKPLSEFTQQFNDIKYINTSLVGAQIDGYENMNLEDALQDSDIVGEINLETNFAYNIDEIKEKLIAKKIELSLATPIIEEGKKLIRNINNDLKRSKNITVDILKTLKNI